MTHPQSGIEKEYFFWAIGIFHEEKQQKLARGAALPGMMDCTARPAHIKLLQTNILKNINNEIKGKSRERILKNRPDTPVFSGYITVTEGRKHEVKRLLKSIDCYCVYLKRVRMGNIQLNPSLHPGEVMEFTVTC